MTEFEAPAMRQRWHRDARGRHPGDLYWSRRGEIACATHAPAADSARWLSEGWTAVPPGAGKNRIVYQCQHCSGRPIQHRARSGA
jgi:hypothetical protein